MCEVVCLENKHPWHPWSLPWCHGVEQNWGVVAAAQKQRRMKSPQLN